MEPATLEVQAENCVKKVGDLMKQSARALDVLKKENVARVQHRALGSLVRFIGIDDLIEIPLKTHPTGLKLVRCSLNAGASFDAIDAILASRRVRAVSLSRHRCFRPKLEHDDSLIPSTVLRE